MVGRVLFVTLLGVGIISLVHIITGESVQFASAAGSVLQNKLYLAFLVVQVLFSARLILFRLRDRDV